MNSKINIKYDHVTKKVNIECEDNYFDTERLSGINISEWAYPFILKNVRWNGLYDELKDFYGSDSFSVVFYGTDDDLLLLKQAFNGKPVNVVGLNNKVIILYDSSQLTTKITINGKIFDTSKLTNRSIDEWVFPFSFKDAEWKGIFTEIASFLGTNSYSIQFMGKSDDMRVIMDNCPENIDVTYKPPIVPKKKTQPAVSKPTNTVSPKVSAEPKHENQYQKPNMKVIKGNAKGLINGAKIDYQKMQKNDSGLLLFGKIAVIVAVICCIVFTIYMSRFLMILSVIPSIVFCVLAFTKDYKKLAVSTFIVCILLAIISWIIITIRWNIALKELDDIFDDMNDTMNDINDVFAGN